MKLLGTRGHSPTVWVKVGGGASSSLRKRASGRGLLSALAYQRKTPNLCWQLALSPGAWNLESDPKRWAQAEVVKGGNS